MAATKQRSMAASRGRGARSRVLEREKNHRVGKPAARVTGGANSPPILRACLRPRQRSSSVRLVAAHAPRPPQHERVFMIPRERVAPRDIGLRNNVLGFSRRAQAHPSGRFDEALRLERGHVLCADLKLKGVEENVRKSARRPAATTTCLFLALKRLRRARALRERPWRDATASGEETPSSRTKSATLPGTESSGADRSATFGAGDARVRNASRARERARATKPLPGLAA